jgi:hypothetical protein
MNSDDFLSPIEELVLIPLIGEGAGQKEEVIWSSVRLLCRRPKMSLNRVNIALQILEQESCVYSWRDDESHRRYRMQFRGERALRAALDRRGRVPSHDCFHKATRGGILWDLWRGYKSRKRATRRPWYADIYGRRENI